MHHVIFDRSFTSSFDAVEGFHCQENAGSGCRFGVLVRGAGSGCKGQRWVAVDC